MRAIVWTDYGPPEGLRIQEVGKPVPKPDELLIRIRATAITAGDCELRALRFSLGLRILVRILMGLARPRYKILGQELSGEVEAIGREVTSFRAGDQVFGTTGFGFGAYAEYICLPETPRGGVVAIKPASMTFEEAATVPTGGLEALRFLRKAGSLSGRSVLINGAGGGIGMNAVQLAKHFGAEVTGVESPGRLELVRSLGADHLIDYTREDFSLSGKSYDVIFDVVGKSSYSRSLKALRQGGSYLLANPTLSSIVRGRLSSILARKKVVVGGAPPTRADLDLLKQLIDAGSLRSVIDRRFPLEGVPEAHRYVDSGLARGRVAILL